MNNPEKYVAANSHQRRDAEQFLDAYIHKLSFLPGDVILDIGCGPGDVTNDILLPRLPKDVGHVHGVDIASNMVEYAKTNFAKPKMTFSLLDICVSNLNYFDTLKRHINGQDLVPEGLFDKAFSFFCLHWASDMRRAMQNMYDLMKPGGEALILFISSHPFYDNLHVVSETTKWQSYMQDIKEYIPLYQNTMEPRKEFSALLEEVGFEVVSCFVENRSYPYQSKKEMENLHRAVNPFTHRIPENLEAEYNFDCEDWIRKLALDENEVHTVHYSLIEAHLKKQ